jgi:hypothetical protein
MERPELITVHFHVRPPMFTLQLEGFPTSRIKDNTVISGKVPLAANPAEVPLDRR